jgi:hypothetical protein
MAMPADAAPAIPVAVPAPAAPPPLHSHVSRAALTSDLPRGPCCLERAKPTQERATPHIYIPDTHECPPTTFPDPYPEPSPAPASAPPAELRDDAQTYARGSHASVCATCPADAPASPLASPPPTAASLYDVGP